MSEVAEFKPHQAPATAVTPRDMLNTAVQSGAGIETLERLMNLSERHDANNARKAYDNAMAELRAKTPTIIKSTPGHGYKYEQLADITEPISPIMAELGLSFRWRTESPETHIVKVTCIIAHKDGHSEENWLQHATDKSGSKNDIQALGSAVTYLQRYTLKAAVGIAAAKDDDGVRTAQQTAPQQNRVSLAQMKKDGIFEAFQANINKTDSEEIARAWFGSEKVQTKIRAWPQMWQDAANDYLEAHIRQLNSSNDVIDTEGLIVEENDGGEAPAGSEWVDDLRGPDEIIEEFRDGCSKCNDIEELEAHLESFKAHPTLEAPTDQQRLHAIFDEALAG